MQAAPTPIVPRGSTEVAFAPIPPTATVALVSRTNFSFYFNLFIRVVWCGVVWCGVVWCGVVWCRVVWRARVCRATRINHVNRCRHKIQYPMTYHLPAVYTPLIQWQQLHNNDIACMSVVRAYKYGRK